MEIQEIWKPVKNYENLYEVSNLGKIRSVDRNITTTNGTIRCLRGKPVACTPARSGYVFVMLYKDSVPKRYSVHRVVAETFLPNPENLPQVNHIDEDRANNCVYNLEWCTQSENIKSRKNKGEKKVLQYDKDGHFIKEWNSIVKISEELGIKYTTIQSAVSHNHFCSNYFWRYYSENYPLKIEVTLPFWYNNQIYQYDLEGNFIREWDKVIMIESELGIDRSGVTKSCGKKEGYSYKGFQWRYKRDVKDPTINIGKVRVREGIREINQYTLDGEFIKTWKNAMDAARGVGLKTGGRILQCCKGTCNSSKGYIWKYADE